MWTKLCDSLNKLCCNLQIEDRKLLKKINKQLFLEADPNFFFILPYVIVLGPNYTEMGKKCNKKQLSSLEFVHDCAVALTLKWRGNISTSEAPLTSVEHFTRLRQESCVWEANRWPLHMSAVPVTQRRSKSCAITRKYRNTFSLTRLLEIPSRTSWHFITLVLRWWYLHSGMSLSIPYASPNIRFMGGKIIILNRNFWY